jgi:hypothetical protein
VPIGRYVEVPIGVSHGHPYATSGSDAQRTGRSRAHGPAAAPKRLWNEVLPHRRLLPPTVLVDGTLIVGCEAGVYALDPASGAPRWFADIGMVRFSPSVTPTGELVAVANGRLVVLSAKGAARQVELPFLLTGAALVLDSGSVVAAGRDGQVHAFSLDGTPIASLPTSAQGPLRWTALVGGDSVLVAGQASELSVLSLRSGNERRLRLSERVATSPVVGAEETIWVLGAGGTLWVVGADARIRASAPLGQGEPADSPALGWDGALRVGLRYGEIACFSAGGQERWRRGLDSAP